MKKLLYLFVLLMGIGSNAQKYFPKVNNLFLYKAEDESLFSEDLNYFKVGVRAVNDKLFYKNFQNSNASNSAFYSLRIIPRFVFEKDFLETGILLKFNAISQEEFPSFPITFTEHYEYNDGNKSGNGRIVIGNKGLSLLFENKEIIALDSIKNKKIKDTKAEFIIKQIDYLMNNSELEIELFGGFTTAIRLNKMKLQKSEDYKLFIIAKKETITFLMEDPITKNRILIKEKKIVP